MPGLPTRIEGPLVVIGDVHGQAELLERLLGRLARRDDYQDRWIVFIGDFVDRGPDPAGAVERVLALVAGHPRTTAVCGNHDLAFAAALGLVETPAEADWAGRWVDHFDSDTTFASYGVDRGDIDGLSGRLPSAHARFLSGLPWCVEHPDAFCVHAGLDPHMPFDLQRRILHRRDLSLHRPPWLCSRTLAESPGPPDCPVPIVSGHVRVPTVRASAGRFLVDTTGGRGGELSGLLLPERQVITSASDARRLKRHGGWLFGRRVA